MYINPHQVKAHNLEPDKVLGEQLKGWVYESHAWVVVSETNLHHKICRWCGAQSKVDMQIDEDDSEKALCPKNPLITGVIMQVKVDSILP